MTEQIRAFNISINPLTRNQFAEIIEKSIRGKRQLVQNGVNAAAVNELSGNEIFIDIFNKSDLVNIDGMSVVWALRYLGYKIPERVACPDLAGDLFNMAVRNNFSVYLFGASEKSITACVNNVKQLYPGIRLAGYRNGYFNEEEEAAIVQEISKASPDILFIGMPSPRKEFFIDKYRYQLGFRYALGVGGYFDILSGMTRRAPLWMQKSGLEWFFRFIQEPRRMWNRYMVGNLRFVWLVLKEKQHHKKRLS